MDTDIAIAPDITATTSAPAGFWIRLVASLIDTVLITAVTVPLLIAIYGTEYFSMHDFVKGPADFLISYVMPAVLVIVFWMTVRGTPGKLLCGLRVVDARNGETLDLLQAVLRYLGYFISLLLFGLGFLWVAFDARKQGFHDKIARSLVVKQR